MGILRNVHGVIRASLFIVGIVAALVWLYLAVFTFQKVVDKQSDKRSEKQLFKFNEVSADIRNYCLRFSLHMNIQARNRQR